MRGIVGRDLHGEETVGWAVISVEGRVAAADDDLGKLVSKVDVQISCV